MDIGQRRLASLLLAASLLATSSLPALAEDSVAPMEGTSSDNPGTTLEDGESNSEDITPDPQTATETGDTGLPAQASLPTAVSDFEEDLDDQIEISLTSLDDTPSAASIPESTLANVSTDTTSVLLSVSGGQLADAANVAFEVSWGQGTRWIQATRQADGSWTATVSSSQLGSGTHTVTTWATVDSSTSAHTSASFSLTLATSQASVAFDASLNKIVVHASSITCTSGVAGAAVQLSSPSGDCRWYALAQDSNGTWYVNISPSDYAWAQGTYTATIWVSDASWRAVKAATSSYTITYGDTTAVTTSTDTADSVLQLKLSTSGSRITQAANVAFEVVGSTGTLWIQATRADDGSWSASTSAAATGSGTVAIYSWATIGSQTLRIASASLDIPSASSQASIAYDQDTQSIKVAATNLSCASGIKNVAVAVSSPAGTVRWYALSPSADGSWSTSISPHDFAWTSGTYTATIWFSDTQWKAVSANTVSNNITYGLTNSTSVSSTIDTSDKTLSFSASGGALDLAWNVAFCVTDNRGSNTWLSATKTANGTWAGSLSLSKLAYGSGSISVYASIGNSASCLGKTSYLYSQSMTDRIQSYSSTTSYLIAIDTTNCYVGVYTGSRGNWKLLYDWPCAPGTASTPTVTGTFKSAAKGYYFDAYGSRCFYYTQFYGDYLFHSVLCNPDGSVSDGRLGEQLSHGCVRLALENAKWIYDNIPTGTTVVSY